MNPAPHPESPEPAAAPIEPPSLRRLAPLRADFTLSSGRALSISRGQIHLNSGQKLFVAVVPPRAEVKVEIREGDTLKVICSPSVRSGPTLIYEAEYAGLHRRLIIPLPNTDRLYIVLADGVSSPLRMAVPITVWPSFGNLVVWWLTISLTLVGARWQAVIARGQSLSEIARFLWDDLPFIALLFLATSTLLFLIPTVGRAKLLILRPEGTE